MKQSELKKLSASGAAVKVVRHAPTPQPQQVEINVKTEPQQVDITVETEPQIIEATVDVQALTDQLAILTVAVQELINERRKPLELEVVRNARGEMTNVRSAH